MEKEEREAHQTVFMTEPSVVIVATIAFGTGIDKAGARRIFHSDLPGRVEVATRSSAARDATAVRPRRICSMGSRAPGSLPMIPMIGRLPGHTQVETIARSVHPAEASVKGLGKPSVGQHCRQSLRK